MAAWQAHTHLAVALEAASFAPEAPQGQPLPIGQGLYLNPSPLMGTSCQGVRVRWGLSCGIRASSLMHAMHASCEQPLRCWLPPGLLVSQLGSRILARHWEQQGPCQRRGLLLAAQHDACQTKHYMSTSPAFGRPASKHAAMVPFCTAEHLTVTSMRTPQPVLQGRNQAL